MNKPSGILKIVTLTTACLLTVHFVIILMYCFRDQLPAGMSRRADRYVIPMFHQNWKLFAPNLPEYDVNLEYRFAKSGNWAVWEDASDFFGYGPHSRIETIEQGFNSELGWQVVNNFYSRDGRKQYDRMVQSGSYASALFFVMKMHQMHRDPVTPDSVQVRLNFRFTPAPDRAYTVQNSMLEFPVYAPPK